MKRTGLFSVLIAVLLLASCDNPFTMREPVPVVVQTPVKNVPPKFSDTIFLIEVSTSDVRVKFDGAVYNMNDLPELDTLVRQKGGVALDGRVALKYDAAVPYSRIISVTDLLGRHEIRRFSLVSDLHDK